MAEKVVFTDRMLKSLKAAPKGKRYEYFDAVVPGLSARIGDKVNNKGKAAQITLNLIARYPGTPKPNPTRRKLGRYPQEITLEQSRQKARQWLDLIGRGIDPSAEQRRAVEAEDAKRGNTFATIIEEFIRRHVRGKRKAADVEREIRREMLPMWKDKSVAEITRRDVVRLIEAIADRPAPYQAHNIFSHGRTFFNWAIERDIYGLEKSPFDRLKPARLIGPKKPRQRVLSDDELFAYVRASDRLGAPFGAMFKMLALTGQRKSEVSDARWREFDFEKRIWIVPPERFKSDATQLVPLTDDAVALLRSLPRFNKGDHLFSTTFGEKPVSGFSKAKARLDRRMLRTLGALARRRRENQASVTLVPFVIHDVRRTVRTRLSGLKVPSAVAEMVIGHGKKGLARVYDQHEFLEEMREALEAWNLRLRTITMPAPANVIRLKRAS
ncbi:MAG: site-specific integrase [Rhodomicrobium sp.]